MKTVVVKTQAEFDALPNNFEEYTTIEIRSSPEIVIQITKERKSSHVEARDSSHVEARDSSQITAFDSSRVVACDLSRVEATNSSSVLAFHSSKVMAFESSSVVAKDLSRVVAFDSSHVEARDSSSVVAKDSSRVMAFDSSHVEARDSSNIEALNSSRIEAKDSSNISAFQFSTVVVFSPDVNISHLADKSVARLRGVKAKIKKKDKTALVLNEPTKIEIPFNTWLQRGYVVADGITKKLISQKTIGEIEVFTVKEFFDRKESYVVKRGKTFSHGETVENAIESLRYKLSDRDTKRFKNWTFTTKIKNEDAIQAYRAITGACELGTRKFCESITIPKKLTVEDVIRITKGHYGNEEFANFFQQNISKKSKGGAKKQK